jgi:hypothetical protein
MAQTFAFMVINVFKGIGKPVGLLFKFRRENNLKILGFDLFPVYGSGVNTRLIKLGKKGGWKK